MPSSCRDRLAVRVVVRLAQGGGELVAQFRDVRVRAERGQARQHPLAQALQLDGGSLVALGGVLGRREVGLGLGQLGGQFGDLPR